MLSMKLLKNNLTLNIDKCNVLIISNKNIVDSIDIFYKWC